MLSLRIFRLVGNSQKFVKYKLCNILTGYLISLLVLPSNESISLLFSNVNLEIV